MSVPDLSNLRQLPGLAHRPTFPEGLQVLLVDDDVRARQEAEEQLRSMSYVVTACSSSQEAAAYLAAPGNSVDILLVDVHCVQQKTAETNAFVQAARTCPLVLMSESGAPSEVMLGIKLGAMDFLEKPLSVLKLKNIWQHTVRRLMAAQQGSTTGKKQQQLGSSGGAPSAVAPEDSAGGSHGSGGESGSNASTCERAAMKAEHDMDVETSSFGDGLVHCAPGGPSCGAVPTTLSDPMQLDVSDSPKSQTRPLPQKYKAARAPASSSAAAVAIKPVMGHPAGQMPPLPNIAGVEWGLPTNPLQISPKLPAALLGSMPWLHPMMNPAAAMFPPMMVGNPVAAIATLSSAASVGSLHAMQAAAVSAGGAPSMSAMSGLPGAGPAASAGLAKRADSAPLPAVVPGVGASELPSAGGLSCSDLMMPPPPPLMHSSAALSQLRLGKEDLFMGMDVGRGSRPPIGLQLKKSPSLADFISQTLKHGDSTITAC